MGLKPILRSALAATERVLAKEVINGAAADALGGSPMRKQFERMNLLAGFKKESVEQLWRVRENMMRSLAVLGWKWRPNPWWKNVERAKKGMK